MTQFNVKAIPPGARTLIVVATDCGVIVAGYILAFLLRFHFRPTAELVELLLRTSLIPFFIYAASFWAFSLYRGLYRFSSVHDLLNLMRAVAVAAVASAAQTLFVTQERYPRSVLLLHPVFVFLGAAGVRFGIRLGKTYLARARMRYAPCRTALLVGTGHAAEALLRQILTAPDCQYRPVGILDPDQSKWGLSLHGVKVIGGINHLRQVAVESTVDEVIIAVDSQRAGAVFDIMAELRAFPNRIQLKIVPTLEELLRGPGAAAMPSEVRPVDLLNREEVRQDMKLIGALLHGKSILVSGGGGTIGLELCRQILAFRPAKLVFIENQATALFYAEMKLKEANKSSRIVPVLGDIRDQALIGRVFSSHRPQIVLHAAAHKHVGQLEENVHEGVSNNVLGTYYFASAAKQHGAEIFLLVSTDKAVRPASVMGATKRVAELLVRAFSGERSSTRFAAVRFGNVLGSSGSVLEIFKKQLAVGGPLTVSHPDVQRYFMTVEEAVQLILQAAAMAQGGEIFVLKMGTPVRILGMARNLIALKGLEPDKDVLIQITGLKDGEKMNEELIEDPGDCRDSEHPSIMILKPEPAQMADMKERILGLEVATRTGSVETLVRTLKELVPTYAPSQAQGLEAR